LPDDLLDFFFECGACVVSVSKETNVGEMVVGLRVVGLKVNGAAVVGS
jgi:hypothetical protein